MVEDLVGGIFKVVGRLIGQIFLEIIFELLIKGPGYLIVRAVSKSNPDLDSSVVTLSGLLFWCVIGGIDFTFYLHFGSNGGA